MEKVLIYPYDDEVNSIIQHADMLDNIEIVSVVSPNGWGMVGETLKINGSEVVVKENFEQEIKKCNSVWFVDSKRNLIEKKFIFPKIDMAKQLHKKIRYFRNYNDEILKILGTIREDKWEDIIGEECIFNIETPVILICGICSGVNKFGVQLEIRRNLLNEHINFVQIGSRLGCEMFGMEAFPSFMFDSKYSEKKKILLFNHFIKKIETNKKPELIVIGVPGGIGAYSKNIVDNFGMTLQEVSQAVIPDCSILSMPYDEYCFEDLEFLQEHILNKYNFFIDYFNLALKRMLLSDSEILHAPWYLSLDKNFIKNEIDKIHDKRLFCIDDKENAKILTQNIINQLLSFGKISSM